MKRTIIKDTKIIIIYGRRTSTLKIIKYTIFSMRSSNIVDQQQLTNSQLKLVAINVMVIYAIHLKIDQFILV